MAAPPSTIPCSPWTTEAEIRACCSGLRVEFTGDQLDAVINFVSALLFRLSGRKYTGACSQIIWPCSAGNGGCGSGEYGTNWWAHTSGGSLPSYPYPGDGGWYNFWPCAGACHLERVKLPNVINTIDEIIIDGEILDPTAYKIEAYKWLVRVDGGKWPCSNNLAGEPGDEGVWTVEYTYGQPIPADARYVASIFACEMAKARCGADNCLPERLKTITRQGVSMSFADPLDFLEQGQTGIYEVDAWLRSVNPNKIQRRSRIYRPDRKGSNTTFS